MTAQSLCVERFKTDPSVGGLKRRGLSVIRNLLSGMFLIFHNRKDKKQGKKKQKRKSDQAALESKQKVEQLTGIRFPESKGAGTYLRSSKVSYYNVMKC